MLLDAAIAAIKKNDALLVKSLVHAVICSAMQILETAESPVVEATAASTPAPGLMADDDSLARVQQWVQSVSHLPPMHQIGLDELAESVGLARSRFAQLVRQETGDSPGRFLTRCRIHLIANELVTTQRSVTDLALSHDFSSTQHFAKVFKRYMGGVAVGISHTGPVLRGRGAARLSWLNLAVAAVSAISLCI